jgi:hypothetical protein
LYDGAQASHQGKKGKDERRSKSSRSAAAKRTPHEARLIPAIPPSTLPQSQPPDFAATDVGRGFAALIGRPLRPTTATSLVPLAGVDFSNVTAKRVSRVSAPWTLVRDALDSVASSTWTVSKGCRLPIVIPSVPSISGRHLWRCVVGPCSNAGLARALQGLLFLSSPSPCPGTPLRLPRALEAS